MTKERYTDKSSNNEKPHKYKKGAVASVALLAFGLSGCSERLSSNDINEFLHTGDTVLQSQPGVVSSETASLDDGPLVASYDIRTGKTEKHVSDDDSSHKLDDIVNSNRIFLEPAAKSGALDKVRIAVDKYGSTGDGGDMLYRPGTKTIEYALPKTGSVDTRLATVMTRHETIHALVQGLDIVPKKSDIDTLFGHSNPVDVAAYERSCGVLRDEAIQKTMSAKGPEIVTILNDIKNDMPEQKIVIDGMIISIESGMYTKSLDVLDDAIAKRRSKALPGCAVYSPKEMLLVLMGEDALSKLISQKRFYDLPVSKNIEKLDRTFQDGVRGSGVFDAVTEATYLQGIPGGNRMGHPHTDANELVTSIMNIAITYPSEFKQELNTLPDERKQAIIELLTMASDDLIKRYPEEKDLTRIIAEARQKVLS